VGHLFELHAFLSPAVAWSYAWPDYFVWGPWQSHCVIGAAYKRLQLWMGNVN
jgi:hypothetical protein